MKYQKTFKRFEMKYLLTKEEKEEVLSVLKTKMKLDKYGRTTIRNIYFDTDTYRLIRRSIEKPVYKEKLRLRSYQSVKPEDEVFIELKKKYKSVVYKRRLSLSERQTMEAFLKNTPLPVESQIAKEIEYFREFYQDLKPKVFLSYEREAYYALDGSDFRVTFDENILYRNHHLSLGAEVFGTPLLNEQMTLMEIKTSGGIPLWMSHVLTKHQIYKTSFSKYGFAYQNMYKEKGGILYV